MKTMQPTDQKTPGDVGEVLPVGIEQPGFFPYARFPLSTSRETRSSMSPLTVNSDIAIWPPSMNSKPERASTTPVRKKAKEAF